MVYMAARPTDGTGAVVRATNELAEVRWVSLAKADELMSGQIFEPVRQHLQQTLKAGNGDQHDLPRHSVSAAAAVIREDGRVLAIRRADNGEWAPPGGIVELDEDPRDTVRREVLEETGVTVEPGQLTGVYKNMRLGVVSLVFRCRPLSGTPHQTEEATQVEWLDRDQIIEWMTSAFAIRLTDALDAGQPRVRIHDGRELLG
jgi:8-oxo-dGTP pyrophosphatase MutT (NUDIX family)